MSKIQPQKIGIGAGFLTAGVMTLYFIFMKYLNLVEILELRALNFFILLGGILMALNRYRRTNDNYVPYLQGFGLGLLTTGAALVPFSAFIGIYLSLHPVFMDYIKQHVMMGSYMNPPSAALGIFIEGCVSGLIISFACMQYYKKFARGPSATAQ